MKIYLTVITMLFSLAAVSAEDMKPYQPADAGFTRFVFRLPQTDNDDDRKIEVVVGKVIPVDCNRTRFVGNLEQKVVKGWGYSYYVVRQITGPASTLMACPDGEKTNQFVQVRGDGFLQRYNHKLPVVVYVPEGYAVRYRIWSAGEDLQQAQPE